MDKKEVLILTTVHALNKIETGKINLASKELIVKYQAVHEFNEFVVQSTKVIKSKHIMNSKGARSRGGTRHFFLMFKLGVLNACQIHKTTAARIYQA